MNEVTKSGRTVEEALAAALNELQTTKDHVNFQVVEEAKKGIFGLGSRPAVVQVKLKEMPEEVRVSEEVQDSIGSDSVEESEPEVPVAEETEMETEAEEKDPLETARAFLQDVTEKMGIDVEIEEKPNDRGALFELSSEKVAILIGKRGSTLNALQYLTNIVVNRQHEEHVHIMLDAENYRERRKEALEQLAKRQSDKVRKTGRKTSLDPMPSMERKAIHIALKDEKGITTYSEGSDPNRRVVIAPAKSE
ncbi:MAG TPA: RNA-binding cell elongation regulator Jag/EloR [Bacillales bacterium]|nr:RNA-binding cell elongation regulator Jag/EloR [Bacillales bacterium]